MPLSQHNLQTYNQRVKRILPGGIHYNFRLPWEETPLHFVKSKGSRLWDMNGNQYLDFYARFGALIVGHGNEQYNDYLKQTIDRVLSVSHSDLDAEVLEALNAHIPSAEMIRFGLSGTEIVQNAIRLARAWTGRNRFIRFEGHYHGNADNIMGGKSSKLKSYIPSDFKGDLRGTDGRAIDALESQSYLLPWNNIEILEAFVCEHHHELAAIITEPICVNAGSIMPQKGYLESMRSLCDRYGIVLIFDEIITGFRSGLGGAQTLLGVIPDLTALGKAIGGGGLPVAALAGKKEIMQLLVEKKVIHAGTFNGYPLGMAAVKATVEILSQNQGAALQHMNKTVEAIHDLFKSRAQAIGIPLIIQGPPAYASYHCCEKPLLIPSDYTFDIMTLDIILNNCLVKNGILVSTLSRIYPNILINDDDVNWFAEHIDQALMDAKIIFDEMLVCV
ncbi:MAG: aminotransferase class III-fold pyridoxal phosphate-dependent enzyme [Tatlockia sp.]|nr:aminotransferase class III-fold pyridoxal phosphate-dependent enzyme [Tatlockia sp.]